MSLVCEKRNSCPSPFRPFSLPQSFSNGPSYISNILKGEFRNYNVVFRIWSKSPMPNLFWPMHAVLHETERKCSFYCVLFPSPQNLSLKFSASLFVYACTHSVVEAAASVLEAFPHAKLKFGQLPGSSFSKRRERARDTAQEREPKDDTPSARVYNWRRQGNNRGSKRTRDTNKGQSYTVRTATTLATLASVWLAITSEQCL